MPNAEIPASAIFYVRGAIERTVTRMEEECEEWEEATRNDEIPEIWKSSIRGALAYQRQWLREAKEEFAKLPEELQVKKFN